MTMASDAVNELEWYGASVQIEHRSAYDQTYVWSIDWAYVEVKARSADSAKAKLRRMFRENIIINYCQLC